MTVISENHFFTNISVSYIFISCTYRVHKWFQNNNWQQNMRTIFLSLRLFFISILEIVSIFGFDIIGQFGISKKIYIWSKADSVLPSICFGHISLWHLHQDLFGAVWSVGWSNCYTQSTVNNTSCVTWREIGPLYELKRGDFKTSIPEN